MEITEHTKDGIKKRILSDEELDTWALFNKKAKKEQIKKLKIKTLPTDQKVDHIIDYLGLDQ